MPELPEVETLRCDLDRLARGRRIVALEVLDPSVLGQEKNAGHITGAVGQTIRRLERRGKYLVFQLESGQGFVLHLRMTGYLLWRKDGMEGDVRSRPRLILRFDSGESLWFLDVRRFGRVYWQEKGKALACLECLGPDALNGISPAYLRGNLRTRRTAVKNVLMDQRVLAGIGNIYAQEALFEAGIRPHRRADRVTRPESERLLVGVRRTLRKAITRRGSTWRDFRDLQGRPGRAQHRHWVYDREGKPCLRCGSFLQSVRLSGRASVYCPRCQK